MKRFGNFKHTVSNNATHQCLLRFFIGVDRMRKISEFRQISNLQGDAQVTRTNARPMASARKNQASSAFALSVDEGGNVFLTDEDVTRLTGYRHSKKVIVALEGLSIPYILNARGKPLVLRSSVDVAALGKARDRPARPRKEWRPL